MELHYYQKDAITATVQALREGLNPVIQMPTGSGKSLVIAHLASKFAAKGGRMMVLTHVKELVEQNEQALNRYSPDTSTGVCCAGMRRDEPEPPVVFASIQSVYKRAPEFTARGLNLIMVDEAHLVPPDGDGLMYTRFLKESETRRIGLSATPWRLDGGAIFGEDRYFDVMSYQLSPLELVDQGYLAPLRGIQTEAQLNMGGVKKVAGEYSMASVDLAMGEENWLNGALKDVVKRVADRKHVLVFCPSVHTAKLAMTWLTVNGQKADVVTAETPDRDDILGAWKAGEFKFMCNVDILTTGFNFPALDAIVCLRPTMSSALWVQMLGRGMRTSAGKVDCIVLDYVGNLERLGGVDTMETWVREKNGKQETVKKDTDEKKEKSPRRVNQLALSDLDPMLGRAQGLVVNVVKCSYVVRKSGRQPGKSLLLAVYDCETEEGIAVDVTQFVCVEYDGGARWHAEQWAKRRGYTNSPAFPRDAHRARVECYALPTPRRLQVRRNDGHLNVLKEFF